MASSNSSLAVMAARAATLVEPVGLAPWRAAPETAEYVHRRGAIPAPDPNTGNFVISSFTVQNGYAAVITHVLFAYNGTGQIEGDAASLFYMLRVDQRYFPRDFETITTSLGSLTHGPYPIPGGLRLKGGETLEGLVNVPLDSPIAPGSPNYVFCHLIGWQWPDREQV